MTQSIKEIIDIILTPASWLYGCITFMRNKFFDWGILKQRTFATPVIVVGNISVGGTGKTPHVEYIIEQLYADFHIGVLSRGYKRKTKGFILANDKSTPNDIGDEPYQIYRKFKNITLAVCENRCEGIEKMKAIDEKIDLFILDDAFQHRYVKPTASIALVDYNHPLDSDHLLPRGRLREPKHGILRADIVIATKCPEDIKPVDISLTKKRLDLFPSQKLYYTTFKYYNFRAIFPEIVKCAPQLQLLTEKDTLLVVTGIANHVPFVKFLNAFRAKVKIIKFTDHHNYSRKDFNFINGWYDKLDGEHKYIITTEKDAVKLSNNPYYPISLRHVSFYMPIKVDFINVPHNDDFVTELKKIITKKH